MDSLGGNISPPGVDTKLLFTGISGVALFAIALLQLTQKRNGDNGEDQGLFRSLILFCYSCFLKPHPVEAKATQQEALEAFYSGQASIYDSTRKTLLKGREDMLALVAAQLRVKAEKCGASSGAGHIWVDVCFTSSKMIERNWLTHCRLAAELAGTSSPCRDLSMFLGSFRLSTSSISHLRYAR
jgi:betaine lipid synthase